MKKLFYLLVMPLLLLGACEDTGEEVIPEIGIDIQTSQFEDNGGVNTVTFTATTAWSVQVTTTRNAENWCMIEPTSGEAGEVTLTVTTQPNTTPEERTATVTIIAGDIEKSFTVTQKQKDVVTIENSTYSIEAEGGQVEIVVSANVEYTYSINNEAQSWVSFKETRAVTTSTYVFEVAENTLTEERSATISFAATNGDESLNRMITITQAAAELPAPASNEIWYTSTDGNIVTPYAVDVFGATIVSNTYENGLGVITFDGEVNEIGADAFALCTTLQSVTLPDSLTKIGDFAFNQCSNLKSFTLHDSLAEIGVAPFYYCSSLKAFYGKFATEDNKALIIDNKLKAYAAGADATSYGIPDGITAIDDYAFTYSSNLQSVTIPNSVTQLGRNAFWECINLQDIAIPDGVTSIGISAFGYCKNLQSITIPDSVTEIGATVFSNCGNLKSITIPKNVTKIENNTFAGCSSLENITLPNGLTKIGMGAFGYCSNLHSVTIPNSVTEIGDSAFWYCSNLQNVTIPDSVTTMGSAFEECSRLQSVTISNNLTKIENYTFYNCSSLESVNIPNSVISIGQSAFDGCTNLQSAIISNNVTSIGRNAFTDCISLSSIIIPDSVTEIGLYAFSNCDSLQSATISANIHNIPVGLFMDCGSLHSIYCKATTPPNIEGSSYCFRNHAEGRKFYVPAESVEAYKTAESWREYADAIEGYNF